jgi:hypothetical protein
MPPAKAFWSIILYEGKTQFLVADKIGALLDIQLQLSHSSTHAQLLLS